MRRVQATLIAACAAALTGFVIHVATQEAVQSWVSARMQGRSVRPSWDVRYLALATSLEIGLGVVVSYALVRDALPWRSSWARGIAVGALLLAVNGQLVRQPIMDLAVGNPALVVIVQDGVAWLLWPLMSILAAIVYDRWVPLRRQRLPE